MAGMCSVQPWNGDQSTVPDAGLEHEGAANILLLCLKKTQVFRWRQIKTHVWAYQGQARFELTQTKTKTHGYLHGDTASTSLLST